MKTVKLLILFISFTFLVSCSDPVLNASSYEVMRDSYKTILYSLPNEEKTQFSDAYNNIVVAYLNHPAFTKKGEKREIRQKRLESVIGGMNAQQIIDASKDIWKKRAVWDIRDLEKRIAKIKKNNQQLKLVSIDEYKLYVEKDGNADRIFLDIVIHNGSKYKLTIADFLITIGSSYSDGISPIKKSFYVTFPEGLKQGQTVSKKIDLGYSSSQNYLPKEPILEEYITSKVAGNNIHIDSNIHPTLSDLEKWLKSKKIKYEESFSRSGA